MPPDNDRLLDYAKSMRRQQTDAKQRLWHHLRGHRLLGLKFKRQQPLGPYIVDFVCHAGRLIVEVDGGQHDARAAYDARRDAWLKAQGFAVLRFWNHEVQQQTGAVLEVIARTAGALSRWRERGWGEGQ